MRLLSARSRKTESSVATPSVPAQMELELGNDPTRGAMSYLQNRKGSFGAQDSEGCALPPQVALLLARVEDPSGARPPARPQRCHRALALSRGARWGRLADASQLAKQILGADTRVEAGIRPWGCVVLPSQPQGPIKSGATTSSTPREQPGIGRRLGGLPPDHSSASLNSVPGLSVG